jgi:2-hydroxy-3-keto-5-methylthiopentenyl-1-phosphate phosphatase
VQVAILDDYQGVAERLGPWDRLGDAAEITVFTDHQADDDAVVERLAPEVRAHVEVRANRATCSPAGLSIAFHGDGGGCGRCGFCKGTVVDELHARGRRVAMCGDGTADRCAADRADKVFARGRLVRYCEERGIPHATFETFDEVSAALP